MLPHPRSLSFTTHCRQSLKRFPKLSTDAFHTSLGRVTTVNMPILKSCCSSSDRQPA